MAQPLQKTAWQFLTKLNIVLTYNLEITVLGIDQTNLKTYIHAKICTQMFIAVLLTIASNWRQENFSSISEWINCATSRQ